jgi:hypothetical protein
VLVRSILIVLALSLGLGSSAGAQALGRDHATGNVARSVTSWTSSAAGAGFGIGLHVGLIAFDDAMNSDRKVWTSATLGAGVGALAGYLIGRARNDERRGPTVTAHYDRFSFSELREREQARLRDPWLTFVAPSFSLPLQEAVRD